VANKGVAGYGTWKSVRKMGKAENRKTKMEIGRKIVVRGPCFVPCEEWRAEREERKWKLVKKGQDTEHAGLTGLAGLRPRVHNLL